MPISAFLRNHNYAKRVVSTSLQGLLLVAGIHILSMFIHFLMTSNITDTVSAGLLTAQQLFTNTLLNPKGHERLFVGSVLISLLLWVLLNEFEHKKKPELVVVGAPNIIGILLLGIMLLPMLSITVWAIGKGAWFLKEVVTSEAVRKNNFWVGMAIALLFYTPSLRPSVLKRQTWKKLKDIWLNWWSNRTW